MFPPNINQLHFSFGILCYQIKAPIGQNLKIFENQKLNILILAY